MTKEQKMDAARSQPCADAGTHIPRSPQRWFWLSEVGPHGYGTLVDGPHDDREGVEQALYLFKSLGLDKGREYVCAEVIETPVTARSHGANEDAISTLNSIGLAPVAARATGPASPQGNSGRRP